MYLARKACAARAFDQGMGICVLGQVVSASVLDQESDAYALGQEIGVCVLGQEVSALPLTHDAKLRPAVMIYYRLLRNAVGRLCWTDSLLVRVSSRLGWCWDSEIRLKGLI